MTPRTTEQQEEYNRLVEAIENLGRYREQEDDEEDFLEWGEEDE